MFLAAFYAISNGLDVTLALFLNPHYQVLNDGANTNLLFEEIAKEKLVGICNGSISTIHSNLISPIDLAASCGREEILQVKAENWTIQKV